MFNSYRSSTNSSTSTNVTVNVEPQDAADSARLLKEMQEEALENLKRAMPLEGNSFRGEVMEMMDVGGRGAMAVFEINGKRMTAKVVGHFANDPGDLIRSLHEEMSRVIAAELLTTMLHDLPKYTRIFR